ncbi:MAG: hypothetical protein LBU32_05000 [Clostridiales bacterium]|jgi:hypothetical protein|nr:hypothetical protein [Clostridiales bacterium]
MPGGYDEKSLRTRLSCEMNFEPKPLREAGAKAPKLLIDIQAKMLEGYGKGFENWATAENLKRSAKTLIYIRESGIDSYEKLGCKCSAVCVAAMVIRSKIRDIKMRQNEINEPMA